VFTILEQWNVASRGILKEENLADLVDLAKIRQIKFPPKLIFSSIRQIKFPPIFFF